MNRSTSLPALGAASVALLVMTIWGFRAATAPFEDTTSAPTSAVCSPSAPAEPTFVLRGDVRVSVYNAGKRSGRAQEVLTQLEGAGFRAGAVGNAAPGDQIKIAEVRTNKADDPAAQLVAFALGKKIPITVTDELRGPGINVVIGDKFKQLNPGAPRKIQVTDPVPVC